MRCKSKAVNITSERTNTVKRCKMGAKKTCDSSMRNRPIYSHRTLQNAYCPTFLACDDIVLHYRKFVESKIYTHLSYIAVVTANLNVLSGA